MAARSAVILNVYDLSEANESLMICGLGVYHTGVEVFGLEYMFGGGGGVASILPKQAPNAVFRTSIVIGEYKGTPERVSGATTDPF